MNLCVDCDHMDQASQKRWAKALAAYALGETEDTAAPEFDHWKPYCTLHKRQPVTDPVTGTHLDGPPYLRCMEVRKTQPVRCRDYRERQENDNSVHG